MFHNFRPASASPHSEAPHPEPLANVPHRELVAIWRAHFGRTGGWLALRGGQPVAELSDYVWADMFWDNYAVRIVADGPAIQAEMSKPEWWSGDGWLELTWQSRAFPHVKVGPYVFPAACGMHENRVSMRGLYLWVRGPNWWEAWSVF